MPGRKRKKESYWSRMNKLYPQVNFRFSREEFEQFTQICSELGIESKGACARYLVTVGMATVLLLDTAKILRKLIQILKKITSPEVVVKLRRYAVYADISPLFLEQELQMFKQYMREVEAVLVELEQLEQACALALRKQQAQHHSSHSCERNMSNEANSE